MTAAAKDNHATMIAALHRELELSWTQAVEPVHEISRYALLPPGKLLRPLLLLESARAVGGDPHALVPAALSVEYLHAGSLVHDDIIDGDELRRGKPSVQAKYGTPDAIVCGDALMLGSIALLADHARRQAPAAAVADATKALAEAGAALCRGQMIESELTGDVNCGMARYRRMIELKTGALFRVSSEIGALLGGGTPEQTQALSRFGGHLGLAFQMRDDLLPYIGPAGASGKPETSDVVNQRPTFPVLLGYAEAGETDRRRIELALGGVLPGPDAFQLLCEVFAATGALEIATSALDHEVALAKSFLVDLPVADGVAALSTIADSSIDRWPVS
jgi:geranylgeranyl pyrophosphate synthase